MRQYITRTDTNIYTRATTSVRFIRFNICSCELKKIEKSTSLRDFVKAMKEWKLTILTGRPFRGPSTRVLKRCDLTGER